MTWYKLDENRRAVKCDAIESCVYKRDHGRVGHDRVGDVVVSTVFLGLDYSYYSHIPLLFETMTFGLEDDLQQRYETWDEAELGHKDVLGKVRGLASATLSESKGDS